MIKALEHAINPHRWWNPNTVLDTLSQYKIVTQEKFSNVDALRRLEIWRSTKEKKKDILVMLDDG